MSFYGGFELWSNVKCHFMEDLSFEAIGFCLLSLFKNSFWFFEIWEQKVSIFGDIIQYCIWNLFFFNYQNLNFLCKLSNLLLLLSLKKIWEQKWEFGCVILWSILKNYNSKCFKNNKIKLTLRLGGPHPRGTLTNNDEWHFVKDLKPYIVEFLGRFHFGW